MARPPKWKDKLLLQAAIDAYFAQCESQNKEPGIMEMYRAIDLTRGSFRRCQHKWPDLDIRGMSQYTHRMTGTRLYRIWDAMRRRSTRSQAKECYRGIVCCPEWQAHFEPFRDWALANGYEDHLCIDRKDSSKNYEPSNCRWATYTENNRNRKNVRLDIEKVRDIRSAVSSGKSQKEMAIKYGIRQSHISRIISGHAWKE